MFVPAVPRAIDATETISSKITRLIRGWSQQTGSEDRMTGWELFEIVGTRPLSRGVPICVYASALSFPFLFSSDRVQIRFWPLLVTVD